MTSQPMHSTPKKFENSGTMQNGHFHKSGSDNSGIMSMEDLESTTAEKQRKELRLLITELKDRDRELNDMVELHQQQLAAWERARQRALLLESKKEKFKAELKKKTEQIRLLVQKLKVSESKHKNTDSVLDASESRMKKLEKDMSVTAYQVQDLKDQNVSLSTSLTDQSREISTMEAREQESETSLRIKEKELRDSSDHVSTLSSKLSMLDAELQDSRHSENCSRAEIQEERSRSKQTKVEMDSLKAEMQQNTAEFFCYGRDMSKLKDEIHKLQKEIYIRDDEIRRKDDLIDLQKSKQDRTGKELAALRLIYERQQQELAALHFSLADSQDLLEKQDEHFNHLSQNGLDLSDFEDCGSDATNDLLDEARMSANSDILMRSEVENVEPSSKILSHSSPTTKLQRLLAESREMVHNLERTASTPMPRPNSGRESNGTGYKPYY